MITLKLLIDYITEANRESVRNAEKELHNLRLKDYDYDISKVVTKIRMTVKTLEANGVLSKTLISDAITALSDDSYCEDYRLDIKFYKKDFNQGKEVDI